MNAINERIFLLIKELKISQTDFAKKLNIVPQYMSRLKKENSNPPSSKFIETISLKFNVNEDWLINGTGEMFNPATDKGNSFFQFGILMNGKSPAKEVLTSTMLDIIYQMPEEEAERIKTILQNHLITE